MRKDSQFKCTFSINELFVREEREGEMKEMSERERENERAASNHASKVSSDINKI